MSEEPGVLRKEDEMREHEREARERSDEERGPLATPEQDASDDPLGTPEKDAMPAPPGNVQGGSLGGAS